MINLFIFLILSIPIVFVSRRSLISLRSHGFYRLFAWEGILWLAICNWKFWFHDPGSPKQLISWLLLLVSLYLIAAGIRIFLRKGKINRNREDNTLFDFEKTTELIDTGIYRHIRHPMYASMLYLTWGIFFKNTTASSMAVAVLSSVFLYLTARLDEKECMAYFGNEYRQYMARTKMFVPFLF
jgi:protein-S-isoprenylcysteine O-methyltransferase Ste14